MEVNQNQKSNNYQPRSYTAQPAMNVMAATAYQPYYTVPPPGTQSQSGYTPVVQSVTPTYAQVSQVNFANNTDNASVDPYSTPVQP